MNNCAVNNACPCTSGVINNVYCFPSDEFKSKAKKFYADFGRHFKDDHLQELAALLSKSGQFYCPALYKAFESISPNTTDFDSILAKNHISQALHGSYDPERECYWNSKTNSWEEDQPLSSKAEIDFDLVKEYIQKYSAEENCQNTDKDSFEY